MPDFAFHAGQLLYVVPDFVRQHVGLGEFAGRAKPLRQFVVETQIDVDLFVFRTIEWPGRRLGAAAA